MALIVLTLVLAGRQQGSVKMPSPAELSAITDQTTHVSQQLVDAVSTGGVVNPLKPADPSQPLTGPSGKPQVLYIGAEYCPYCASERWSVVVALSRFGQFQNLRATASTTNDVYPNTSTFSFYQSQFSSPYIEFISVETETRDRQPLQTPSAAQKALLSRFDPPQSIPFIDIGNRYLAVGSGYDPGVLSGLTWQDIAGGLKNPSAPITKSILGNANYLTAAICQVTQSQPVSVCTSSGVTTTAKLLGS